ncbi:COX15/CtaA family protein [Streptomyces sp. NPDC051000]|uniref:COX15/CtaA family protein n=1 Tax=Streptomyces sp. NPDC051000 TaxID=3155520 RepID=UPI0033F417AD
MRTPLSWAAGRFTLGPRSVRWAATTSVVAAVAIVVGGGIVRVTGSGLGCPEWPMCTTGTLAPTSEMGLHGAIEFGNRLLTGVLCLIVGWVVIAARLQRHPMPAVLRGAWAQFWVVVLNALVGGVTVWMRLSPYVVAAHFLAATLLLMAAVWTRHAVPAGDGGSPLDLSPGRRSAGRHRSLSWTLVATTALLVVVGTVTTGSGPHAGDSSDVRRMPFDWATVTVAHGVLAAAVLLLAGRLLVVLPREGYGAARRTTALFVAVLVAQGAVGLFQSLTGLPALAVTLHLLGSALVWVGVLRVHLTVRAADEERPGPHRAAVRREGVGGGVRG